MKNALFSTISSEWQPEKLKFVEEVVHCKPSSSPSAMRFSELFELNITKRFRAMKVKVWEITDTAKLCESGYGHVCASAEPFENQFLTLHTKVLRSTKNSKSCGLTTAWKIEYVQRRDCVYVRNALMTFLLSVVHSPPLIRSIGITFMYIVMHCSPTLHCELTDHQLWSNNNEISDVRTAQQIKMEQLLHCTQNCNWLTWTFTFGPT